MLAWLSQFDFLAFEQPGYLLVLLLIIPTILITYRSVSEMTAWKTIISLGLRITFLCLLAMALARPAWQSRTEYVSTTVILDRSQSIPLPLQAAAVDFLNEAAQQREETGDRLGVVTLGRDARIVSIPTPSTSMATEIDPDDSTATNLADGVRLALAMAPGDTANRLLLVSDGNENVDFILHVSDLARANGVPIDVLPLEYAAEREVIFEQLITPARVRLGQSVNLRMVLRAIGSAQGRIYLRQNGELLDINPGAPGDALPVTLQPGPNAFVVTLNLNQPGRQRFDAVFEPDSPSDDLIAHNNTGVAVTFAAGEGRVLIVDELGAESEAFHRALQASGIAADILAPAACTGLDFFAGYDAVVLANVPRWQLTDTQVRDLHTYIHDLGGGFIMLGGNHSFGAGGWIGSTLAEALPVNLDPPHTRQLLRGALAIVIDTSGSMAQPVRGTGMTQQEVANEASIAGIRALNRLDHVTVVGFSGTSHLVVPLTQRGSGDHIVSQVRTLAPGGGTNLFPALDVAAQQLALSNAGAKHIVILSDGHTMGNPASGMAKAAALASAGITITTIGIGDGADVQLLQDLATVGNGRLHLVQSRNSQAVLPQILIQESQLISRSLIQEGDDFPTVTTPLPGPTMGLSQAPAVRGYVLTAARDGLSQTPMTVSTSEGQDPLYAFWNYGLGKSIAFTSDVTGRWGTHWVSWDQFRAFWAQSVRWVMRPNTPSNIAIQTRLEGSTAVVELEALSGSNASFVNFLTTHAVVIEPDSTSQPLTLTQVGPGRYRGEFNASATGAYLVNVAYAEGSERGNVQAAVCIPYPREYADLQHNAALLHDVARRTGGRILDLNSAQLPNLYSRDQIDFPYSRRAIWDLLTMIAAAVLLLDVAARRLAVDRGHVAGFITGLFRRTSRTESATVAAWKTQRAAAAQSSRHRTVKFDASQFDSPTVKHDSIVTSDGAAPTPQAKPSPEQTSVADPTDITSRLFEAKRRARQQQDKNGIQDNDETTRE